MKKCYYVLNVNFETIAAKFTNLKKALNFCEWQNENNRYIKYIVVKEVKRNG